MPGGVRADVSPVARRPGGIHRLKDLAGENARYEFLNLASTSKQKTTALSFSRSDEAAPPRPLAPFPPASH